MVSREEWWCPVKVSNLAGHLFSITGMKAEWMPGVIGVLVKLSYPSSLTQWFSSRTEDMVSREEWWCPVKVSNLAGHLGVSPKETLEAKMTADAMILGKQSMKVGSCKDLMRKW